MHAVEIYNNIQFLHTVYKSNVQQSAANYKSLKRWGKIAYNLMRVAGAIILASCLAFVPLNFVENIVSDERLPLLQTFVIGLDEKTDVGYGVLYTYHLAMLFLAGVGTCSVDLLLFVFVIHMVPLVELFSNMYAVLNEALKTPASRDSKELVAFFENTICMHSDICE